MKGHTLFSGGMKAKNYEGIDERNVPHCEPMDRCPTN